MKYLPPIRPKLVPKLKKLRLNWNLTYSLFRIWTISILMSKIDFVKYLSPGFIEIWHIWYFKYADLNFNVKNNFYETFTTCQTQIGPIIKSTEFIEFGTFDISNVLISILMSKMIFMEHLPIAKPKLFPKSKKLIIYWNLTWLIFQMWRFWI